jgi:hypothetical protein
MVGYFESPFVELEVVHDGRASMPLFYDNDGTADDGRPSDSNETPFYSECGLTWGTPQDWTIDDADTLTLYFRGEVDNVPEPLYAAIEDTSAQIAVVKHPDTDAVQATEWQKWHISLADLQTDGVDVTQVKKMYLGVGDRDSPQPGGTGKMYIDDIRVTNRML